MHGGVAELLGQAALAKRPCRLLIEIIVSEAVRADGLDDSDRGHYMPPIRH